MSGIGGEGDGGGRATDARKYSNYVQQKENENTLSNFVYRSRNFANLISQTKKTLHVKCLTAHASFGNRQTQ